jgi:hypothetical protein
VSRATATGADGFEVLAAAIAAASRRLDDLESSTLFRHNGTAVVVSQPPVATYDQLAALWSTYDALSSAFATYDEMSGFRP